MHLSADITCRIRQLELYTKRLLLGGISAKSRSSVKGSGLDFEQMRDYVAGDDIRYIDWKASSRLDRIVVREYTEEKNKTIMLAVDISQSMFFACPDALLKEESAQQLAAVLALVAGYAQDQVGLILFSDRVELYIPPRQGLNYVRNILQRLFTHKPTATKTSMNAVLDFAARLKIRNALLFIISDFFDTAPLKSLTLVAKRYDCIAAMCHDPYEYTLPPVGFLPIVDSETGNVAMLDVRNKKNVTKLSECLSDYLQKRKSFLVRAGVQVLSIETNRPFIDEVVRFFQRRREY